MPKKFALIPPVLGSGMAIWIHSLIQAYRTRSFGDVAVAGWNTVAQVYNTWEAASNAPSAFKEVTEFFSGDSDSAKVALMILMIVLVVLVIAGGIFTNAAIARWADRRVTIDVVAARA